MSDLKIEMPLVPIPHEIYFDDYDDDDDDDDELLDLVNVVKIRNHPTCKSGSFVHKKSA